MMSNPAYLDDAGCLALASSLHQNHTLKNGRPYLLHIARVGAMLRPGDDRQTGYLHDVIEDCEVTAADLRNMGVAPQVADAVSILTRRPTPERWTKFGPFACNPDETYDGYITRLLEAKNPTVRAVKLADVVDHVSHDPQVMPSAYIDNQWHTFARLDDRSRYGIRRRVRPVGGWPSWLARNGINTP